MSDLKEQLLAEVTNQETGLTLMEEAFLDNLFEFCNGNVREAMTKAGYPKDTPESHVTKPLGKYIRERAKEYLTSASALASVSLVNLLIDPNQPGAKNVVSAAKEILDRSGVYKEEGTKVTEVRNMFILPPKNSDEDYKIIEHE
jgi:hypothetical protein